MIEMRLSEIVGLLKAVIIGRDIAFRGCGTDTRALEPAQLFVALRGLRFDGHEFVGEAEQRRAAAVLLERRVETALPTLLVENTRVALGQLAGLWRNRFMIPIVAVTGSNGKTTVKEMIASILSLKGRVLATRGNLNNDIGMPQTLFELGPEHHYGVIEMGANHPGEIASLCKLARPAVAAITQCAPAHLEGFDSLEGVARAKGEILAGLDRTGTAVINADDEFAPLWQTMAGTRRQVSFGLKAAAEVTATSLKSDSPSPESWFCLTTPAGSTEVRLGFPGRHNVMNALAAAACAHALGIAPETIGRGLEAAKPVAGRLNFCPGPLGARVLDDTYNANPGSLKVALQVLAVCAPDRWLVLGDMGELGRAAEEYHRRAGVLARELGISRLYALGELSRHAVDGFGQGGQHFSDIESLLAAIHSELHKDVTLLVKGSRAMRMERVVRSLQQMRS